MTTINKSPEIISHDLAAAMMRDSAQVAGQYQAEQTKARNRLLTIIAALDDHARSFTASPHWGRVGDLKRVNDQLAELIRTLKD